MAAGFSTAVRNAWLQAIADAINGGSAGGLLRGYDGTQPATGGSATTLLFEATFADPMEASISGGSLTADTITGDASANASGTCTWCRIVDSSGTFVMDGNATATGGGGVMQLVTTTIVATQPVDITSFSITAPNA